MPRRLQRRRGRGWRMPAGALYVGRPTIWGNPFAVTRSSEFHGLPGSWFVRGEDGSIHHPTDDSQTSARQKAVELYAAQVLERPDARVSVEMIRAELAGLHLVCWCPRDEPCHADFLLTIANSSAPVAGEGASVMVPGGPATATGCGTCGVSTSAKAPPFVQVGDESSATGVTREARCPTCGHG